MAKPLTKRIYVSRAVILANEGTKGKAPPIRVATYKDQQFGYEVEIKGASKLRYDPKGKPGERVWIETTGEVVVYGG